MLSTPTCGATESSVHSVLGISKGYLSMPNDLNLSVYRSQSTTVILLLQYIQPLPIARQPPSHSHQVKLLVTSPQRPHPMYIPVINLTGNKIIKHRRHIVNFTIYVYTNPQLWIAGVYFA